MRERALKFGKTTTLAGVLAEPVGGSAPGAERRPALLFLNSGILHHTGASRIYVKIARRLAARGYTSLRFDFSGIGDSEARKNTLPFAKAAVAEAIETMDFLQETRGFDRFVIIGLCSGADMAYHIGLADERVVGIAKMDAWVYRTRSWFIRHYAPKILNLRQWVHSIRVRLRPDPAAVRHPDEVADSVYVAPEYRRRFPPREEVARGLARFVARNVRLYYYFTGDQIHLINHRDQYRDSFPEVEFGSLLTVDHDPTATHTITGLHHQEEVTDAIERWVEEGWGASRPAEEEGAAPEPLLRTA